MFDRNVIKKYDPVKMIAVMKYVKTLRSNILPKEKPMFSQMISSGSGAL
jgi:hypothetical protein